MMPENRMFATRTLRRARIFGLLLILAACSEVPSQTRDAPRLVGPVPTSLALEATGASKTSGSIEIGNAGRATLDIAVTELPAWVELFGSSPTSVPPGESATVTLTADCTSVTQGDTVSGSIALATNDPDRLTVAVPISLGCLPPSNAPPTASFAATPLSGPAPLEVSFDATASTDEDGVIASYAWSFGDGSTATGAGVEHTFDATGMYTVRLDVVDDDGAAASQERQIVVSDPANRLPVVEVTAAPSSGTTLAPVTVTFEAEAHDPDGSVVSYDWTIGDEEYEGESIEHAFSSAGSFEFQVTVTDDDGAVTVERVNYEVLAPYRFSPASIVLDLGEPDPTVTVNAEGPWILTSASAWLTPSATNGDAGQTTLTLAIDDSTFSGDHETSALELRSTDGGHTATLDVTVNLPDVGAVTPEKLALSARLEQSGSDWFVVTNEGRAALSVTAAPSARWLTVTPEDASISSNGSKKFVVTAACGATETRRTGSIDLAFDDPDFASKAVEVTIDCVDEPLDPFDIELRYYGDRLPTASQRQEFEKAVARWSEVIVEGLPDVSVSNQLCYVAPLVSGTIDDVRIYASVTAIDGRGGTVARAGWCRLRSGSELPYAGFIEIDSEDFDDLERWGLLDEIILHEIGHVLGIGSLWEFGKRALVDPPCRSSSTKLTDATFIGDHATTAHVAAGGDSHAHVETDGGAGTACAHWDEARYGRELMTGTLSNDGSPLSAITIGSLEDLGYRVSYATADSYDVPSSLALQQLEPGFVLDEILWIPDTID